MSRRNGFDGAPPQSSLHHLQRDGDLGAEFLRLREGAAGQRLAGNAGRKAEIILDARRRAGLPAESSAVEHDHRQAFRGAVDRGGKAGGSRAHHGDVVDGFRIELRRDAEAHAGLGVGRALEERAVRADHQRQFVRQHAEALHRRAARFVGYRIEHRIGIGVAAEKAFEPQQIGRAGPADEQRADAALLEQPDAPQDEGAHHDLADLGGADHQRADMRGVERQRRAALRPGNARGERALPGQLTDLAAELAGGERDHRRLPVQAVAPHDLQIAVEHQPGRRMAHADVIDHLAGREIPRRGAGETLGGRQLQGVEHRKHLLKTRVGKAHCKLPGGRRDRLMGRIRGYKIS